MLKPPTGEPCAGEPHARFGGRGGRQPFPTPIKARRKAHNPPRSPLNLRGEEKQRRHRLARVSAASRGLSLFVSGSQRWLLIRR